MIIRAFIFGFAAMVCALVPDGARAHPHVWVIAKSELVYAPDGSITGVRHAWTFDEVFSTFAVQGLQTKTKGVYTREELAGLAKINVENLKEFGFFTFAKADGKKEAFNEPEDGYYLEHVGGALVLHFTLPLKRPLKAAQLEFEVFDPTYFVDFQFAEKDAIKLAGAPASCRFRIDRPDDNAAAKQKLSEKMFASGDAANYGQVYASKVFVNCAQEAHR